MTVKYNTTPFFHLHFQLRLFQHECEQSSDVHPTEDLIRPKAVKMSKLVQSEGHKGNCILSNLLFDVIYWAPLKLLPEVVTGVD